MARGPLPKPGGPIGKKPTIATTELPKSGRKGRAPKPPKSYDLGPAGQEWWAWAWKQPEATRWTSGDLYFVARRAEIEDDLAALDAYEDVDLLDYLGVEGEEIAAKVRGLERVLSSLKSLSGGKNALRKEARELDNRLGLNPKAKAELRWTIVDDSQQAEVRPIRTGSARRLRVADLPS